MGIENLSGRLSMLRVHNRGTGFGPPTDKIDVEVVIAFVARPNDFFGFQLRSDSNLPAREGMLGLLRDGFNFGWTVNIDFDKKPGKRNSIAMRVWLTKPPGAGIPNRVLISGSGTVNSAKAKSRPKTASSPQKKQSKKRTN